MTQHLNKAVRSAFSITDTQSFQCIGWKIEYSSCEFMKGMSDIYIYYTCYLFVIFCCCLFSQSFKFLGQVRGHGI